MWKLLGIVSCIILLVACATSPTGRSQVLLYSNAQLADMGAQAFSGMKSSLNVSRKTVENQYVQCIASEEAVQRKPKCG